MANEVKFKISDPARPFVLVPAYVNGQGPFEFILDTGASMTMLSTELAKQLRISGGKVEEGMGAGGKMTILVTKAQSLSVGVHEQKDIQVGVMDFAVALGKQCGGDTKGIIGFNYLKNYAVTVDYPASVLRLQKN